METIKEFFANQFTRLSMLKISPMDIVEILIIAVLIYNIIKWVKKTKAWTLVKGIIVLFLFYVIAYVFSLDVILWIFVNTIGVGITAVIILFQPELRKALEQLGKRTMVSPLFDNADMNVFSDQTVNELVKATFELAKTKTGALIVIERDVKLDEYEQTGIAIDAIVSNQLLINIFEHNTPLHDGAVIVRGNRITSATCYLPLSDNMRISKELGTRHRAAVGISEATDSFTIVVSEETGSVSIAVGGNITRRVGRELLLEKLKEIQNKSDETKPKKRHFWKDKNKIKAIS
ncbi:MAG: diadenylate cyclase CdaA, partial [Lachnospiraceae bacterium]|nr:diadenylate cyclase CdaA [Lachnospiraceae bacterium]